MKTQPFDTAASSTDRDEILALLDETIHNVCDRIQSYEVESSEDGRLLINWHRTLATLVGQYRQLQKDTDIDEIEENIELLQRVTGSEGRS